MKDNILKIILAINSFLFIISSVSGSWLLLALGTTLLIISVALNMCNIYTKSYTKVDAPEYALNKGIKLFKEKKYVSSFFYIAAMPMSVIGCVIVLIDIVYFLSQAGAFK